MNAAELHTGRVMHPERKHQGRRDFWDIEHAVIPTAYSDAWVTLDGNLAALVESCETPRQRGCKIITSMDDLAAWLQNET